MADTSQRKARRTHGSGLTLTEKNKEGASIAQGNEVATLVYNFIKALGGSFDNVENFNQSQQDYFTSASSTYTEAEKLVQAYTGNSNTLSYTASFNANEYTLNAITATVSELIANGVEQDLQDKTVYLSPKDIGNNFIAQFVAPANNTGSTTFRIQKYDGTYHTTLTAKKYSGTNLVNLVAGDIKQNQLYTIVIINGELVVFGIQSDFLQTQKPIIFSYSSPTIINYSAGGFVFDDYSGLASITAGTLNVTGLTASSSWYVFGIYNPTTGEVQVAHYSTLTTTLPAGFTKKKLLFAFVTNSSSQVRQFTMYADGYIEYITPIQESTITLGGTQDFNGLYSLTVPIGIIHLVKAHSSSSDKKAIFIGSAPQTTGISNVLQGNHAYGEQPDFAFSLFSSSPIEARTNTSSEISIRTAFLFHTIGTQITLTTHGYTMII